MAPRKTSKKAMKTKQSSRKSPLSKSRSTSEPDWGSIKTADEYNDRVLEGVDDEEVDSDIDCFDSEDELMYGSLFTSRGGDSDDDEGDSDDSDASDDSDDEDEEEEEVRMGPWGSVGPRRVRLPLGWGGSLLISAFLTSLSLIHYAKQDMLDMLAALDKKTNSHRKEEATSHATLKPSEFSSTTTTASEKLTMDSLLNPLASTSSNFASIRSSMQSLDSTKTTHALQSTVVTDRASSKLAYEASSKDVSNWMETVKANREAETLDFRPKVRWSEDANATLRQGFSYFARIVLLRQDYGRIVLLLHDRSNHLLPSLPLLPSPLLTPPRTELRSPRIPS